MIATLLADRGDAGQRKAILERMAGRVVESVDRRRVNDGMVEKVKDETADGVFHWGRENAVDLQWFGTMSDGVTRHQWRRPCLVSREEAG